MTEKPKPLSEGDIVRDMEETDALLMLMGYGSIMMRGPEVYVPIIHKAIHDLAVLRGFESCDREESQ